MFDTVRFFQRAPALSVLVLLFVFASSGSAGVISFSGPLDPVNWTMEDIGQGGGFVDTSGAPASITLWGGDDGSWPDNMFESTLLFWTTITFTDVLDFQWLYMTADFSPSVDIAGYYLNGQSFELIDTAGASVQSGLGSVQVTDGDVFGFYVWSMDSTGGSGILRITGAEAPPPPPPGGGVPEPSSAVLVAAGAALLLARRLRRQTLRNRPEACSHVATGLRPVASQSSSNSGGVECVK